MPRTGLTSRPVLALAMPLLRSNFFVSSMVDFRNASSTVVGWLSSNSTPPLLTFCQELACLRFVLLESAVHRRHDSLASQFGCLDAEHLAYPLDEVVGSGLAEERVNVITLRCRQTL